MTLKACNSIRTQVGVFLLLLAFFAGAIFFLGWLPHNQRTHLEEQRARVQEHLTTLVDALLPYLLQNQMGAVHETLDSLLERQTHWVALTLTGEGGERLYPLFSQDPPTDATLFPFTEEILFRGRSFGRLTLHLDAGPLLATSERRNREMTAIFFGVMFTAFVFIAVFLEIIAGRPARQLAGAAERLAEGDYEAKLPSAGKNEIGEMIHSFDQMRATIRAKESSLIEARQQAESANRTKSMFLANMSHELRTPLNPVLGFAQLLESDPGATKWQQERLGIIRRSGEHLLELLNDLLDLSKIEAGSTSLALAPFDTRGLLAGIEEMFRQRADEKGLDFSVATCDDLPETVVSDVRKIRQVLLNLVGNAIKFTESGSVRLEARWMPGSLLEFGIRDTGPGIDPDKLDSIFDPFDRGEQEGGSADGAGLGLAICKRFVEHMGGTLRVESRIGEGSIFIASIPVTVREEQSRLHSTPPKEAHPATVSKGIDSRQEAAPMVIPEAILGALAGACAGLEVSAVQACLGEIEKIDPESYCEFARLAEDFRYEELEELVLRLIGTSVDRQSAAPAAGLTARPDRTPGPQPAENRPENSLGEKLRTATKNLMNTDP